MGFPTGTTIATTNLDSGSDDPSLARGDLLTAVQSLNTIIAGAGAADGVALLNSSGQIPSNQIPNAISPTAGVLTLSPVEGFVKIQDILRLQIMTTDQLQNLANIAEGDCAYCSDGATGGKCLAVYNGTNWLRVTLGAAISTT